MGQGNPWGINKAKGTKTGIMKADDRARGEEVEHNEVRVRPCRAREGHGCSVSCPIGTYLS